MPQLQQDSVLDLLLAEALRRGGGVGGGGEGQVSRRDASQ